MSQRPYPSPHHTYICAHIEVLTCYAVEVIGYSLRALCHSNTGSLALYLLQAAFILLAPVLLAATLYATYSRLVRALNTPHLSPLPPRWTTWIFVGGDWLCLNIQGSGSGLLAKPKNAKLGNMIIIAGLGVQVIVFVAFIACCVVFDYRVRRLVGRGELRRGAAAGGTALPLMRQPGTEADGSAGGRELRVVPWKACLNMLYATSVLVLVRNLFRMVEYAMGEDGYLFKNEWVAYVFDGVLMWVVMLGLLLWYPSWFTGEVADRSESFIELSGGERAKDGRTVREST